MTNKEMAGVAEGDDVLNRKLQFRVEIVGSDMVEFQLLIAPTCLTGCFDVSSTECGPQRRTWRGPKAGVKQSFDKMNY